MAYQVGVDLGTTWTAVAVCRSGGPAELVQLGERAPAVPTVAFVGDGGEFGIGEIAERHAAAEPARVVEEFTRRIGDRTPIVVNGEPVAPEALAARFVGHLLHRVAAQEGGPAAGVALTHPAAWGPHKLGLLRDGLAGHGLPGVVLLPEPQAAAIGYASVARVEPGSVIAVYDLGGGTFDAAVLRTADRAGGVELLGRAEGIDRLGGLDFDEAVFEHVQAELGDEWDGLDPADGMVLAAVAGLRRECIAAKEALSQDTEATITVALPGVHRLVRLDRARFEEMIRPAVEETVAALGRAVTSAGLPGGVVPTVVLAGGSSRIPLVRTLVERELGLPTAAGIDPKGVIALGTALAARDANPASEPSTTVTTTADDVLPAESPALVPPPVGVRPFREPDAARPRGRLPVVLGAAASGVLALVIGGSLFAYVAQNQPVTPVGSTAVASTPASTSPGAPRPAPPAVAPPTAAPPAARPQPREQPPQEVRRTTVAPTPAAATTTTAPPEEEALQPEGTTAPPDDGDREGAGDRAADGDGAGDGGGDGDEAPPVAADPPADEVENGETAPPATEG
ncbi:Hsp70 protein [Pseudonocardia hierapolitana]|uniref:Hsp70 protein n=1 Tax=Pseudonocardia hierapolitana TaxID=1128676 RepID=A0A561SXA3_9PSEU|nr:Hsp70 family protein [Pseudonocardia hierapolitana]TWF79477.1 Hsp70 protein [Pseudonocardia hierapolitana]